ncbi:MAG: hypothetical protein WAN51_05145 [Alphaproteobacteria bacterium]
MDFDLKLKALSRLAESTTADAEAAVQKEIDKAAASLETSTQYDLLEQPLAILKVAGHRASERVVQIVLTFMQRLRTLDITYSEQYRLLEGEIKKYHNAAALTVQAVDVLILLRYLETKPVLRALMDLSLHDSADVRKKALDGLEQLCSYDIDVIFGDGKKGGIGVAPQRDIIDEISSLDDTGIRKYFFPILTIFDGLLAPTMQKTSWTYRTMTLSRGQVPGAPEVAEIRFRAMEILKRIYSLATTNVEKLKVIGSLREATRVHHLGENREDSVKMVVRDSVVVLNFFASLVAHEEFSVIQKIEHEGYWIFYHAFTDEVASCARVIETEIAKNAEYQIYKTLIGFEGIFDNWQTVKESKSDNRFQSDEKYRKDRALEFASQITSENYVVWRQRILKYAETRSDDLATFPVFFYFLEQFAALQPKLALDLVSKDAEQIDRFLIPLIRTLSAGPEREAAKTLIEAWTRDGKYLYASIKQFLQNENLDADLLRLLLGKALELNDVNSVAMVMSVAVSNYASSKKFLIDEFFLPALDGLTGRSNADWIFDFWYRRETRVLIQDLDPAGIELVLCNLMRLRKIDYQAEEILYLVAEKAPEKVFDFLCKRLTHSVRGKDEGVRLFDPIPFKLHKLNKPLSGIPGHAVSAIRSTYDGNYGMFIFLGARLLHIVFPDFPKDFEDALRKVLDSRENADIEFVVAVLRNYKGELFIHRICKEIVRILPTDSSLRTEVAIALQSSGVVTGEFGLAEAYERKKDEIKDWLNDPEEKIQDFARWYISSLERMSAAERKRAQEEIALRRNRYGE